MDKIYKIIQYTRARLAIIITLILLLVAVLHYAVFYFQSYQANENINRVDSTHTEVQWNVIEGFIYFAKFQAKTNSDIVAKQIVADIDREYPDLSELSRDFDRGMYYSPKFLNIISKDINGKHLYDLTGTRNDIFVLSRNGIILDNNIEYHNATHRNIHDEATKHYNQILAYNAINQLINNSNNDVIFYEPNKPINGKHIILESPSMNNLKRVFEEEGIEGLAGYIILVPSYITEDGDIFGTPDISSDGFVNENYKIIVVQRFSIYDIIKRHKLVTHSEKDIYTVARTGYADMLKSATVSYIGLTLLDLIALCFLIILVTGKNEKKEE